MSTSTKPNNHKLGCRCPICRRMAEKVAAVAAGSAEPAEPVAVEQQGSAEPAEPAAAEQQGIAEPALPEVSAMPPEAPSTPVEEPATGVLPAEATGTGTMTPPPRPKLSKLSVDELQARYAELFGRTTDSVHVGYLRWRISQAEKGKIPVGPRPRCQARGEECGEPLPPQDFKVLPLRLEVSLVGKLDEAWARLGLRSRTELIRRALHAYLAGAGEQEVAVLLAPRT